MSLMIKQRLARFGGRIRLLSVLARLPSDDRKIIAQIRARKLTYLSVRKLACLAKTARALSDRGVEGVFLEAGCALGGSAILLSKCKQADRPFYVYDVFGMIPPPSENDPADVHARYRSIVQGQSAGIEGEKYYGYESNLHDLVVSNLESFGVDLERDRVQLFKGLVEDTLHLTQPVALAHVDVDWYEPVKTCLARVFPHLSVGGCLILDDYHDWGGCRKATDQFLATIPGQYTVDDTAGSLTLCRTA